MWSGDGLKVVCVDDELPILENFRVKTKGLREIDKLVQFQDGNSALEWVRNNQTDVAFVDMEMPHMHGLELARQLKNIDKNIRIVFVTAYTQYALDAFGVDAIGYILKPYSREDICKELHKAVLIRPIPSDRIQIRTIPNFTVIVNGNTLHLGRTKTEELWALLVDRGDAGVTSGEAISCLWPGRPSDESAQTLYRVTFHRLMELLKNYGIENIIGVKGRKKYIVKELVECDLYQILDGDKTPLWNYGGDYMKEYSWAETRNAQLYNMKEKMK